MKSIVAFASALSLAAALPTQDLSVRAVTTLTPGQRWDYPLGYNPTASSVNASVPFYSVDLFDTDTSVITALKQAHFVTCYFSAGTYEDWRPDNTTFPASSLGKPDNGWPHERWVDTRNSQLRQVMLKRIILAQQKGCQAVDPDNIDGYDSSGDKSGDKTGFGLTYDDSLSYIRQLCQWAHQRGMKCGQKNAPDMVDDLVASDCDFAIVEDCAAYDECDSYTPYVQNSPAKPVFNVEYTDADKDQNANFIGETFSYAHACAAGGQPNFSTIVKHEALDQYVYQCK